MTRTAQHKYILAAAGSGTLLLGALYFQYFQDLPPCKLCIWQRLPHIAALMLGALVLLGWRGRLIGFGGAAAALTSAGLGFYHSGVEMGWWQGPTSCSAPGMTGMDTDALLNNILNTDMVRCDEILWQFAGLSMAGWNMVLSLLLALIWLRGAYQASSSASQ